MHRISAQIKMKICILTQPLGTNYGGVLQAFALQKALKDMGHDVATLRWLPLTPKNPVKTLRRFLARYVKGNKDVVYFNYEKQLHYTFRELDRFVDERLDCQVAHAPLGEGDISGFDAFVVGSDQVWRPMYSPYIPNFYLDFLGDAPVKRIAYAASFGVDVWETDEKTTEMIRPLAQKFDSISVREESGVQLCSEKLGVRAAVMPDPTLLLTAHDYLQLCGLEQTAEEPYIAAYILDKGEREQRVVERLSQELGLPVRYIGQLDWIHGVDSIESWLGGIARASFVITNSFHGTVFSLLFGKRFLSVKNSHRGATRFTSLLDSVGLQDRLLDISVPDAPIPDMQDIDYQLIQEKLGSLRQLGFSFLQDNLQLGCTSITI